MKYVVGIGKYRVAYKKEDIIMIHALSSCVAVVFYNPKDMVGAMIHIALPNTNSRDNGPDRLFYYADTGLKRVIEELVTKYKVNMAYTEIHVIGGANSIKENDFFKIGARNLEEVRTILRSENLYFVEDSTGGNLSRTIELEMRTGNLSIKTQSLNI
ncbi:chemotaxis protein CheD [Fusibacter bizertensis]|uniref:Chemotaxis protein CheD n=1 Tax=Fusibacter bizertensis TaxID=1488331 RepID=A0ABT6NEI9_9FIRM|nr:chemotaxis protein CheD [Fusibacter bizertensis]MDH8678841.1 chemotaxis protein CheD [Fusibacter bizertensis]